MEIILMGGYEIYVWGSVFITLVILLGNVLYALGKLKGVEKNISSQ